MGNGAKYAVPTGNQLLGFTAEELVTRRAKKVARWTELVDIRNAAVDVADGQLEKDGGYLLGEIQTINEELARRKKLHRPAKTEEDTQ
jgi:hypothetical protein